MDGQQIIDKVKKTLQKAVPAGSTIVAAVSGGADSMALAGALQSLCQKQRYRIYVLHVEHGLRGREALHDAEMVKLFCSNLGLPFCCRHVDVRAYSSKAGISVESAARKLRYQALEEEADRVGAKWIVTAHHSDDQAETVLLKLLRGAGTAGLSGMAECNGRLLRPFLHLTRKELEVYCQMQQIAYCHDSSNDDVYYTRNRVRLQLLPYLQKHFNPAVKKALVQTAELLQQDEAFFSQLVESEFKARAVLQDGKLLLDTNGWQAMAQPVRTRLLRRAYFALGGQELGYRHTLAADTLCLNNRSGQMLKLPQQIRAAYAYECLTFLASQQDNETKTEQEEVLLPLRDGAAAATAAGRIYVQLLKQRPAFSGNNIIYPAAALAGEWLTIRSRKNGDRFSPYGGCGSKKLKDYFIYKKIPRQQRDSKLLVCCQDRIIGIFGVANAAWKPGEYDLWLNIVLTEKEHNDEQRYQTNFTDQGAD